MNKRVIVTYSRSGAVKVNDVVVGMIMPVPGQGFAFKHYKFGLKLSSTLPTIEILMVRVEQYLKEFYISKAT